MRVLRQPQFYRPYGVFFVSLKTDFYIKVELLAMQLPMVLENPGKTPEL